MTGRHSHSDPATDRDQGEPPARSRTMSVTRKVGVLLVGVPLLGLGIVLLPLPGPGSLLIVAALAVLSLEFAWADRWSRQVRDGFKAVVAKVAGRR